MRECELVDEHLHLVCKRCNTLRVAEPHLEQRVVPDRDQPRHRLSQLARARVRALQALARLLDQAEVKERDGKQPQQHHLRIDHEDLSRREVHRLHESEPALDPFARGVPPSLQLVHLSVHDACRQRKDGIVRCGREGLGLLRHGERLGILGAQTKQEPEPVQQASAHRMLRQVGKQRVRTLKGALCFRRDAKQMRGGDAPKRCKRDLQRIALGPLRRLVEQVQTALGEGHALRRDAG